MTPGSPRIPLTVLALVAVCGAGSLYGQTFNVGEEFPTFKATDAVTGKPIELEKLRGKVVLVDFWATWCGPCRMEIPKIKAAYDEFHKQGFEVLSISLDRDPQKCLAFIKSNKLDWLQVCDQKVASALATKHQVRTIPQAILIGRDGKIVHTRARGEELAIAVKQALQGPDKPAASQPVAEKLERADALRDAQHYVEAVRLYEKIADDESDKAAAVEAKARLEALRADPQIAAKLAEAENAARVQKIHAQAQSWLWMARQLAQGSQPDMAREYYDRILKALPGSDLAKMAERERAELPE